MDQRPTLPADLRAALGEHFEAFVVGQVGAGRYREACEVLRAALSLLEGEEPVGPPLTDAEIRALVEEGDASGESDEGPDAFFDRLEAELAAMPPGRHERV